MTRAIQFAADQYRLPQDEVVVKSHHTDTNTGLTHVYLRQLHHGEEISNANMNVNIGPDGSILSYGSIFLNAPSGQHPITDTETSSEAELGFISAEVNPLDAVYTVLTHLGHPPKANRGGSSFLGNASTTRDRNFGNKPGSDRLAGPSPSHVFHRIPGTLGETQALRTHIISPSGDLEAVWEISVRTPNDWVNGHVSRRTGQLIALVSWKSHATYHVFPLGYGSPLAGTRSRLHDNQFEKAINETRGNNVYAQADVAGDGNWAAKKRPSGGGNRVFDFPVDLAKHPTGYQDAAVVNLFYWTNMAHDDNNFDKGGKRSDAMIAMAQSGDKTNNSSFYCPPDGVHPMMKIDPYTRTNPKRDGDFDSDLIIHEYSHGVTTRLTGGADNSNCLAVGEAKGLGEGWSDFFALLFKLKASDTRFTNYPIGAYASGSSEGIRSKLYSTSDEMNPHRYSYLNYPAWWEEHLAGEVWATMLYEVLWNVVEAAGFESNLNQVASVKGNVLMFKYILGGLKIQPCAPTFLTARDALVQAEEAIDGGKYRCAIWRGFAKRGLGTRATNALGIRINSYAVPSGCDI
ncbi:Fungalysin metallopeptidase-domain-containing protein [Dimargaris cristalligena]|uniref:Extracellular metalloproteinase n=1 Tax=Dimargaris cristalligena TaxID=215637 RepID=A0A4P9ZRB0_9FUNG|nr:Fungalysin metallopeptidase-domain-containing protein [Dimargaris cristalligena]|eukprot:RKP36044.1 Fungalysin metallopeptidase-domain-containing protein [Dimargaris cristalligena]